MPAPLDAHLLNQARIQQRRDNACNSFAMAGGVCAARRLRGRKSVRQLLQRESAVVHEERAQRLCVRADCVANVHEECWLAQRQHDAPRINLQTISQRSSRLSVERSHQHPCDNKKNPCLGV